MSDTPTYDQLSALCAQMEAALEKAHPSLYNGFEPDNQSSSFYAVDAALTAYRTLSPDPQWQRDWEALQIAKESAGFYKRDTAERVCFYEQDFYVFSNFSAFTLEWKGVKFDTSEAAYHWEKFPLHSDICSAIRFAPSAHEAFKIAERNKHLRRPDWDDVKFDIMRDIIRAKVQQHEYVRRKLLVSGEREIVEDSWRDPVWGWGPNRDGQNMLGKIWMEVRDELNRARGEG